MQLWDVIENALIKNLKQKAGDQSRTTRNYKHDEQHIRPLQQTRQSQREKKKKRKKVGKLHMTFCQELTTLYSGRSSVNLSQEQRERASTAWHRPFSLTPSIAQGLYSYMFLSLHIC